jgi:two-component system chemotaxis response regulator CheY
MSKTVLAVDDSKTMRDMVSFALTEAGFAVTTADDGAHGLKVAQEGTFDVIITDINMPFAGSVPIPEYPHSDFNHRIRTGKARSGEKCGGDGLDRQTL